MPNFFDFLNGHENVAIGEVVASRNKKKAEEVKIQIFEALKQTEAQKNLYATTAQRAIVKAKKAIAANDAAGKSIAYNELKFAYGVYQYMTSLHNAFRTLKSQYDMQEMTETFANVVNSLTKINVPAKSFNFDKLTAKALNGFKGVDMSGLDSMVQKLIEGSMQATNVSGASDAFLDKLISGEVSLDTPYNAPAPSQEAPADNSVEQKEVSSDTADLLAMLDAINAGLRTP